MIEINPNLSFYLVTPCFSIGVLYYHNNLKVKFLCLTKYHTLKTYHTLNQAPYHENRWGSEGIAPCILNFSTAWK